MSRWERVGLVLVTARFGLLLFDAPSYLLAYLIGGAFMGIPAWRIALGALPAIAALVVVGTGGFAGLVTAGRRSSVCSRWFVPGRKVVRCCGSSSTP